MGKPFAVHRVISADLAEDVQKVRLQKRVRYRAGCLHSRFIVIYPDMFLASPSQDFVERVRFDRLSVDCRQSGRMAINSQSRRRTWMQGRGLGIPQPQLARRRFPEAARNAAGNPIT
jgi:hypothetical protein